MSFVERDGTKEGATRIRFHIVFIGLGKEAITFVGKGSGDVRLRNAKKTNTLPSYIAMRL